MGSKTTSNSKLFNTAKQECEGISVTNIHTSRKTGHVSTTRRPPATPEGAPHPVPKTGPRGQGSPGEQRPGRESGGTPPPAREQQFLRLGNRAAQGPRRRASSRPGTGRPAPGDEWGSPPPTGDPAAAQVRPASPGLGRQRGTGGQIERFLKLAGRHPSPKQRSPPSLRPPPTRRHFGEQPKRGIVQPAGSTPHPSPSPGDTGGPAPPEPRRRAERAGAPGRRPDPGEREPLAPTRDKFAPPRPTPGPAGHPAGRAPHTHLAASSATCGGAAAPNLPPAGRLRARAVPRPRRARLPEQPRAAPGPPPPRRSRVPERRGSWKVSDAEWRPKKQPPSCPSRTPATCLRTPLPQNRRPGGHPNGLLPSPEKWGPRGSLDLCKMPPAKSRQCVGRKKLGPNGVEAPGGGRGKKPGPRAFSPPPPPGGVGRRAPAKC
ncbi:basic proline-rich protein-like [Phocoena sinus]|uniref:basic proline-rich protein-like n=1 Tax=Phocoena sinus TaxID=42100 RepID=UPI0013C40F50|nr:basic proline-rich protein-like [Phocoena sinus]